MRRLLVIVCLLPPLLSTGQNNTFVGLNLAPLILNTLDLRFEQEIYPFASVQAGFGIRNQRLGDDTFNRISFLRNYVQRRNGGGYLSVGGRIFSKADNRYQYPYIGLDFIASYYNENVFVNNPNFSPVGFRDVNAVKFGTSVTIGFVLWINDRLYVDAGIQMGYSTARRDILTYYLPGLGYSTFGAGRYGVRGGHVQPILRFKYNLFPDRRTRIREKD
ncbi:MAG: hypothetical protein AAF206_06870 [Bacteroidota bacterium]